MMKLEIGDKVETPPLIGYGGRKAKGIVHKIETLEGGTDKYTVYFPMLKQFMIVYEEQLEFDT
jgi:hypothetical protein